MSDLLRIAEDVLTDHAPTTCDQLDTCACSMAALHREVRHLNAAHVDVGAELDKPWHFGTNNEETP